MMELLAKMNISRKFIFAVTVVVVVTVFWFVMKYDAATYKDIIIAVSAFYFSAQAAVDWKTKKEEMPS